MNVRRKGTGVHHRQRQRETKLIQLYHRQFLFQIPALIQLLVPMATKKFVAEQFSRFRHTGRNVRFTFLPNTVVQATPSSTGFDSLSHCSGSGPTNLPATPEPLINRVIYRECSFEEAKRERVHEMEGHRDVFPGTQRQCASHALL